MVEAQTVRLRGYDSFPVRLGDEMRGERASRGKSLLDVQRELRIKAAHIDAIENSNPDGILHRGYVTGYVRAYARYLGMDEGAVLSRFCAESGFQPAAAPSGGGTGGGTGRGSPRGAGPRDDLDRVIAGSRLAAASRAATLDAGIGSTLRGAGSLAVLLAVVGGLGFGAWTLLEQIQRVNFAPLPDAPEALTSAPDIDAMTRIARAGAVPGPVIDMAALAAVYAMQEVAPPRLAPRDGPISALDPARSGVYADLGPAQVTIDPGLAGALTAAETTAPDASADADAPAVADAGAAVASAGLALVVDSEAWVRVRNATGLVVHEALMQAGESWRAPEGAEGFTLRAGNAGGVFVEVDGVRYGPLGRPGGVVSNILLDPAAVRGVFPPAGARDAAARPPAAEPEAALAAAHAGLGTR